MEMSVKLVKILFLWPGSKRLLGGVTDVDLRIILKRILRHLACLYVDKCKHKNIVLCEHGRSRWEVGGSSGRKSPCYRDGKMAILN